MPFLNKNKIAYLSALTLLFSYVELLIPRFIPFLKLGLSNIVILLSFSLDLPSFLLLTIIKSVTTSVFSGTLFSPFFLISLIQSFFSGLLMYFLNKKFSRFFSIYGISIAGAAFSALIQLGLSSIYLGKGTFELTGLMLIFSLFSGILTAFLSTKFILSENPPQLFFENDNQPDFSKKDKAASFVKAFCILICVIFTFCYKNLILLSFLFLITLIFQCISRRKIKLIPHLSLWCFVLLTSIFLPSGKVLFTIGSFNLTKGALFSGIEKALKLSVMVCLSQIASQINFSASSILQKTFSYYSGLIDLFSKTEGKLFSRIEKTLSSPVLSFSKKEKTTYGKITPYILAVIFAAVYGIELFINF